MLRHVKFQRKGKGWQIIFREDFLRLAKLGKVELVDIATVPKNFIEILGEEFYLLPEESRDNVYKLVSKTN